VRIQRTIIVGLFAIPCAAPLLGAQDARLRERLDPATASAVSSIVDSARAAHIPTEPLLQRALQGSAKHASGPSITTAVRELFAELRQTRSAIGIGPASELSAGAAALHAGATPAELHMLKSLRPRAPLTVAFATLADLASHGVEPRKATETLRTALAKGATDAELIAMRRSVERDIRAGAPPSASATVRAKGLQPKPAKGNSKAR
jgi:hypothetical protein